MGVIRRLVRALRGLRPELRRAVAADAAGDWLEAARGYALAGEHRMVAEMHLRRAEAARDRDGRLEALRAAARWLGGGEARGRDLRRALAETLLADARQPGQLPERVRASAAEAAALFEALDELGPAGDCHALVGDDDAAARAYGAAGDVDRLERTLARQERRAGHARALHDAFEEYRLHLEGGDREAALAAIRLCADLEPRAGEYRRLHDELAARRLASGRVALVVEQPGAATREVVLVGRPPALLGRDPACDLALRDPGISRRHTELDLRDGRGWVRDAGSRNGTLLAGVAVAGCVALPAEGTLALGERCTLAFTVVGAALLRLTITAGLDQGRELLMGPGLLDCALALPTLRAIVEFADGRPLLRARDGLALRLGGVRLAGPVQLCREDALEIGPLRVRVR